MRIMLWIQGWPCTFHHAIAIALKEKYNVENFSALVLGYKQHDYLIRQKDIKYDHIYVVQDFILKSLKEKIDKKYIKFLEKNYNIPSLWMYPIADRNLLVYNYANYTHEEYIKIIQGCFKYTKEFLEKTNPDFIIMHPAESMELLVLHEVAKHMKIPTLMISSTRTGDRFTIHRNTYQIFETIFSIHDKISKHHYKSPYEETAIKYVKVFREEGTVFSEFKKSYSEQEIFFKSIFKTPLKTLKRLYNYFYHYHFGYYKNDYMYKCKSPLKLASAELKVRFKRTLLKNSGIFCNPDYKEDYVYFPLHFEPEIALSLLSPYYNDQISLAENIAKSLPIDMKLYIKEHPMMLGFRPISTYKRLLKMPNIVLVNPFIRSFDLLKDAKIVTSITGSAGWEALILKKPVITFGHVFFNKLEMVKKIDDINKLPKIIKNINESYEHDEIDLINFVSAIFEGSFGIEYLPAESESILETMNNPYFNTIVNAFGKEMNLNKLTK